MEARIRIKYVNQPKPGKKFGNIKSDDERIFYAYPSALSKFFPGLEYTIEYDDSGTLPDGRPFPKFVKIIEGGGVQQASVATPAAPKEYRNLQQAEPGLAATIGRGETPWSQSPQEARKSLEMFVMAIAGKYYEGGYGKDPQNVQPSANEITALVRACKLAWETGMSNKPIYLKPGRTETPAVDDTEGDEIPF